MRDKNNNKKWNYLHKANWRKLKIVCPEFFRIYLIYNFIFGSPFFFLRTWSHAIEIILDWEKGKTIDWKPHSEICTRCSYWWLMYVSFNLHITATKPVWTHRHSLAWIYRNRCGLFFFLYFHIRLIVLHLRCIQYSNRIIITFHWLNISFEFTYCVWQRCSFVIFIRYYLDAVHIYSSLSVVIFFLQRTTCNYKLNAKWARTEKNVFKMWKCLENVRKFDWLVTNRVQQTKIIDDIQFWHVQHSTFFIFSFLSFSPFFLNNYLQYS